MAGENQSAPSGPSKKVFLTNMGLFFTIAIISSLVYFLFHESFLTVPHLPSAPDRLVYALKLQVILLIPFFYLLVYIIYLRLSSQAINPLSGNEHVVEKANNFLKNTLEQFVFAFPNQLILAINLPPDYLHVLPFLVFYFLFGRIAFFVGYSINPFYRSLGFMSTFFPTTIAFFANLLYTTGLLGNNANPIVNLTSTN